MEGTLRHQLCRLAFSASRGDWAPKEQVLEEQFLQKAQGTGGLGTLSTMTLTSPTELSFWILRLTFFLIEKLEFRDQE